MSPTEVKHYSEMYRYLKPRELVEGDVPAEYKRAWAAAKADSFDTATPD
ncbi:MAG: hypothetical protein JNL38_23940 [Myxococcales bacterium]|nr:hypothetical protein [Myxococcales bacterium]